MKSITLEWMPRAQSSPAFNLGLLALSLLLLVPAAAGAQGAPQAPPPDPNDPAAQALAKVEQEGDLAGAIALLEPLRGRPDTQPPVLSFLGALYVEIGRPQDALEVLEPLAEAEDAPAAVLYNAGRAARGAGQIPKAISFLERSLAQEQGTAAHRELGLILGLTGRLEEAYLHLRPWVIANPNDLEARRAAALCAVELNRLDDAERLLEALPPEEVGVKVLQARLAMGQGEPRQAIELLAPLMPEPPAQQRVNVLRILADAYLRVGESAKAIEILDGQTGNDPRLGLYLGQALYQQGEVERAATALKPFIDPLMAMDNLPADPRVRGMGSQLALEYGRVLTAQGKSAEAVTALERGVNLAPDDRQLWQALGQALVAAGRREEGEQALARFQELVESAGSDMERKAEAEAAATDPIARNLEAAMELAQAGDGEGALAAIRKEQELAPEDPRPWLQEISLLLGLQKEEQALAAANRLVQRFPELADAYYLRGVTRMAQRDLQAAEIDFRQVMEMAQGHTAAMNDLAVLLIFQDRRDEAAQLLQQVLELRPDDATARANLDRLQNAGSGGADGQGGS